MGAPSWFALRDEDPAHRPADRPPDCGWVEQMQPFLAAFSRSGDLVLDPFSGWGTTLVACALEGRRGVGLELEPDRARAIERRLRSYRSGAPQRVVRADARRPPLREGSIDLCLTSIPYFGAPRVSDSPGQLYGLAAYERYLALLDEVFAAVRTLLRPRAYVVAMAENVRLPDGTFLPQAWDVARLLGGLFELREERVICYERPARLDPDASVTNRAHEYALVARRR